MNLLQIKLTLPKAHSLLLLLLFLSLPYAARAKPDSGHPDTMLFICIYI